MRLFLSKPNYSSVDSVAMAVVRLSSWDLSVDFHVIKGGCIEPHPWYPSSSFHWGVVVESVRKQHVLPDLCWIWSSQSAGWKRSRMTQSAKTDWGSWNIWKKLVSGINIMHLYSKMLFGLKELLYPILENVGNSSWGAFPFHNVHATLPGYDNEMLFTQILISYNGQKMKLQQSNHD